MTNVRLLWQSYKYFPYEREFAKREVLTVLDADPVELDDGLAVPLNGHGEKAFKRLTYFREIRFPDGVCIVPHQAILEASVWKNGSAARHGAARDVSGVRQSTRYSAHGLHEYKGKFNPQVVRSIGNMLGLAEGAWVLDPFAGSGTTLLECAHIGWNAAGVDLNPLGVLISNAKLEAFRADPTELRRTAERLVRALRKRSTGLSYDDTLTDKQMSAFAGRGWISRIPNFVYLERWFPLPVLAQFAVALEELQACVSKDLHMVFKVIMSDLVREASFQDPKDLRIRRRKHQHLNYPLIPVLIEAIQARINAVVKAREAVEPSDSFQGSFVADSRQDLGWLEARLAANGLNKFDAAISSPPYATALPYIDTQRLSLCLLGLTEPQEISRLDRILIGSREIDYPSKRTLEAQIGQDNVLPRSVLELCKRMLPLATGPNNGFRRQNMPALVYRYFSDMRRVFLSVHGVMRQGGLFALVVGHNKTVLGGEIVIIDTPRLLMEVAASGGWDVQGTMRMDTYPRYDVHQRNSIRSEQLIVLQRH